MTDQRHLAALALRLVPASGLRRSWGNWVHWTNLIQQASDRSSAIYVDSMEEPSDWVQGAIDQHLNDFWSGSSGMNVHLLQAALQGAVSGGKRFRPRLVAAVHGGLGGSGHRALAQTAVAVELLHTAFVVHDDVIDDDHFRRGQPNVPGSFHAEATHRGLGSRAARTHAIAGGVLVGDLALSAALRLVATAPVPDGTRTRLIDLMDDALITSAAGELADVRMGIGMLDPTLDDVLLTGKQKTAVYSFELPMQVGAVLAAAPEPVVSALGEVGGLLGTAFQLHDDLLGVFGPPSRTGKSDLSDLREAKFTALIVHARQSRQWHRIERHWGNPDITQEDAREVCRALEESGSKSYVTDLAEDLLAQAHDRAAGLPLPTGFISWVETLCRPVSLVSA